MIIKPEKVCGLLGLNPHRTIAGDAVVKACTPNTFRSTLASTDLSCTEHVH